LLFFNSVGETKFTETKVRFIRL